LRGQFGNPGIFGGLPPTGVVTKRLCITLVAVSLIGSLSQRKLGFGVDDLLFTVESALDLELWRLLTYPFVERQPFGLVVSTLVLWLFGRIFEASWGSRDFLRFIVWSWVGAAAIAIPLSFIVSLVMPFNDHGFAEGPGPGFDALIMSMAVTVPNSTVLFGFVLPVRARTLMYLLLGFQLIVGIQTGAAGLSTTLGGIAMGYLLTTGNWRPTRMLTEIARFRARRRRRGIYIVPPGRDKTLH